MKKNNFNGFLIYFKRKSNIISLIFCYYYYYLTQQKKKAKYSIQFIVKISLQYINIIIYATNKEREEAIWA